MCDQEHFEDDVKDYTERGLVTRRQFGAVTAGAGLMFMLPEVANAQAVAEEEVNIKTPDGTCDAYFVHPSSGQHPDTPVILYKTPVGPTSGSEPLRII